MTYRHPGLLAKTVTTLDVVSGGRAELGIGAAWYEREHLGLGVPFPPIAERFERLEEAIQICLQMWSDDNGAYHGKHYQLDETLCSPMPVSRTAAADHDRRRRRTKTLRLVAQYADACNIFGAPRRGRPQARRAATPLRRRSAAIPNEIEVTAMFRDFAAGRHGRRRPARCRGVRRSRRVDAGHRRGRRRPGGWLESTFGPAIERLHDIQPVRR